MTHKTSLGIDQMANPSKLPMKTQDSDKMRWIHWVSPFLFLGLLYDALSLPLPFPTAIKTIYAFLVLGTCIAFWIHGIRNAGQGLKRIIFLAAFSASLSTAFLGIHSFQKGAAEGFKDGERSSQETTEHQSKPMETPQNSDNEYAQFLILTTVLYSLLSKLERNRTEKEEQAQHHQAEIAFQQEQLRDAKDAALRAKLAPHFIFNALNTLKAQIKRDPENAVLTTDRLATLFRQVLEISDQVTIPLGQELAFVEAYLGIEQSRFGSRLKVQMNIPEELESAQIPPLSLQVLVENAVKHGVSPLEEGGTVSIGARMQTEKHLEIWVDDPGSGVSTQRGTGTALATLKKRLATPTDLLMQKLADRHRVSFIWSQA